MYRATLLACLWAVSSPALPIYLYNCSTVDCVTPFQRTRAPFPATIDPPPGWNPNDPNQRYDSIYLARTNSSGDAVGTAYLDYSEGVLAYYHDGQITFSRSDATHGVDIADNGTILACRMGCWGFGFFFGIVQPPAQITGVFDLGSPLALDVFTPYPTGPDPPPSISYLFAWSMNADATEFLFSSDPFRLVPAYAGFTTLQVTEAPEPGNFGFAGIGLAAVVILSSLKPRRTP